MYQIFEELKEYIIPIVSSILAYVLGRRKTTAEVELAEADVIKSAREIYTNLVEDVKNTVLKCSELATEVEDLKVLIQNLHQELDDCRKNLKK